MFDDRDLGSTTVHRVGFGAMQLPGRGVMGPPRNHDEAIAVLRQAVERGSNTSTPPPTTDPRSPTS